MHGIVLHSIVLLRCVLYCVVNLLLGGYNSGAPVAQGPLGQSSIGIMGNQRKPMNSFSCGYHG